jgi:phenylpropionate dioxygenase-like ring-hydroxylating dioxygenase large terminal subunit
VVGAAAFRDGARLSVSAETREAQSPSGNTERFEWLDQWYPLAPVCDLDPAAPHGKTVLGLDVVAWYDRGAGEWRVFEDSCPHRLAPLSEGRVDGKGRLQCVYHGWCFDGAGACKFIPQAPTLGPPVHRNGRARVKPYPCVVQNKILWFYPSTGTCCRGSARPWCPRSTTRPTTPCSA